MVICNRIFYFFLYISFVYRNTIVLSNPTSTISTNGNGAIVDPNAAPVAAPAPQVLNASASITPGAPAMTAPIPGAPAMTAPIPGAPAMTAPIPGAPAMTAPIPGAPAMTAPIPGAHAMTAPVAGSPAMATPMTHGAPAMTAPIPGAPAMATPMTHGAPAMTAPIPGAPAMTAPIPGAHAMTAPIAGAPVAPVAHAHTPAASFVDPSTHMGTPITPGGPAMAAAVPGAHAMTAPVAGAPGAHSVTISIPSGNANAGLAGAPAMAAPVAGAPVAHAHTPAASFVDPNHAPALSAPIAGAPVAHSVTISIPSGNANAEGVGAPITSGSIVPTPMGPGAPTMTAPMTPGSHIVATPANPGAPVVAIPVDSGKLGSDPNANPPTKVTIDIRTKEDTQYVKYRTLDVNETEIWYALDGYIISEIQVGGNRRWPKENEVKECKKVLFFKNPQDGKKTLRVIYADEADAYDPDDPPKESTDPTEKVGAPAHGATESSPLSSDATSSYKDPAELTIGAPPATVTSGDTDKAIDGLAALLSATDPSTFASASSYAEHQYKQDENGQTYVEFTVPNEKASGERVTSTTTSGGFTVEEVRVPRDPHGHTIEYEDSDSDDEFIPGEDGDNEAVNLTTYVSRVGRRVRALEDRMDTAEGTIKLLTMTLNYQHELLDFKKRFGGKTAPFAGKAAPFGADFGRHAHFDTDGFRPATSLVSKILDSSEYPSDIKLFVADAADATKLVDLATDKFKVKQEGDEIHYVLESDVNCKLVTFGGKTVWNHREADPHPVGVVFHPDDDKVVVDFDDAIVMYVKKGELAGVAPNERVKHSIVDISLRGLDSDNEDEDKDEDKAGGEAEGGASAGADVETGDAAGANKESGVTGGPSGEAGVANEETTIASGDSGETIVTQESAPVLSGSAPAPEVQTASVPVVPVAQPASVPVVPVAQPASVPVVPVAQTAAVPATPVSQTAAVPATPVSQTAAVPVVDTSATAVPQTHSSETTDVTVEDSSDVTPTV